VKAKEEEFKPKMSVSVVSPWNMKSDEADLFEKRARDLEKHQQVYGESDHNKIMKEIQTRGKHPIGDPYRYGTSDYKDLHLQHIGKIKPAYHQSPDFPLHVAGNKDDVKVRPYPMIDSKNYNTDGKKALLAKEG
jgi:hypothetical protein